ncbi:hypothetical protein Gohar_018379 [Gossypium harknessii]|uniref:Uncharacterized protein n=1 Tax=Gossypium harknessii TaxID=34285 RepID=A0A7J9G950_9ROSI|nr:hypothetical protein [Gossypium harknessii]
MMIMMLIKQIQKVKMEVGLGEFLLKSCLKMALLTLLNQLEVGLIRCSKVQPNLHNNIIVTLLMLQVHLPLFRW